MPLVVVSNQFGIADLQPGQPNLLCLPTWKSLTGLPHHKVAQPPGLSHFTCSPVKVTQGGYRPPPVMLKDEFTRKPVQVKVNPVPVELCLPTKKVVGKKTFRIVNAVTHLLCFDVSRTPIRPKVFDRNQFGTRTVQILRTNWLCVPSAKKIIRR